MRVVGLDNDMFYYYLNVFHVYIIRFKWAGTMIKTFFLSLKLKISFHVTFFFSFSFYECDIPILLL